LVLTIATTTIYKSYYQESRTLYNNHYRTLQNSMGYTKMKTGTSWADYFGSNHNVTILSHTKKYLGTDSSYTKVHYWINQTLIANLVELKQFLLSNKLIAILFLKLSIAVSSLHCPTLTC